LDALPSNWQKLLFPQKPPRHEKNEGTDPDCEQHREYCTDHPGFLIQFLVIVPGCRCDLVWHRWRKNNGEAKANHANEERTELLKQLLNVAHPSFSPKLFELSRRKDSLIFNQHAQNCAPSPDDADALLDYQI
jgi:hypothetical protein